MSKSSEPGTSDSSRRSVAGARPVDRPVDDDPVQPRPERTAPVETVEVAQRGQERLLRDVLRGGCVLDDEIGGPVRPGPVLAKQRLEVRDRSRSGAPNPGALLPAGGHHGALTIRASSGTRSIRGPGAERSGTSPAVQARTSGHETPTPTPRAPRRSRSPRPLTPTAARPRPAGRRASRRPGRASRSSSRMGGKGRCPSTTCGPAASDSTSRAACSPPTVGFSFRPCRAETRHVSCATTPERAAGERSERFPVRGAWSESPRTVAGSRASSFGKARGRPCSRWTVRGGRSPSGFRAPTSSSRSPRTDGDCSSSTGTAAAATTSSSTTAAARASARRGSTSPTRR